MTKKDYKAIAEAVGKAVTSEGCISSDTLMFNLHRVFQEDNPLYDSERFEVAVIKALKK